MTDWDGAERRAGAPQIGEVTTKLHILHADVSDIKSALRDLTVAINRLAVIEERQSAITSSVERAFASIEKIEERLTSLERDAPNNHRIGAWVDRGVFALIGIVGMFLVDQIRNR